MRALLRIGELAAHAGVSPRTVDYYTQLGLVQPACRTDSGYRLYNPATADTITAIKQLEAHGISLDAIAAAIRDTPDTSVAATVASLTESLSQLQHLTAETPLSRALITLISGRIHALLDLATTIIDSPLV